MAVTDDQYREAAKDLYDDNTDIEVDSDAATSRSAESGGAWVQAWVWVSNEEVRPQGT